MNIGYVEALATRAPGARRPAAVDGAQALAGHGLAGDRHADPLSPRQLLLASAAAYADLALPAHALGENLLVDFETAHLVSGSVLQIGDAVRLRLMFQCEACGYLDLARPGVAARIGRRRGVLARVLAGGMIRPGDRILDTGCALPAWSDDWRERGAERQHAGAQGQAGGFEKGAPGRTERMVRMSIHDVLSE
jgi:hypothetical protein